MSLNCLTTRAMLESEGCRSFFYGVVEVEDVFLVDGTELFVLDWRLADIGYFEMDCAEF